MKAKTRPALFDWTSNFNAHGTRRRVYQITEPESVRVLDDGTGQDPGSDRHRVWATLEDVWVGASLAVGWTEWVVWTKGYSNHGNSSHRRTFDTFDAAERHIKRWATRRWRVTIEASLRPRRAVPDSNENYYAHSGCDRCICGCKYWHADLCHSCGESFDPNNPSPGDYDDA